MRGALIHGALLVVMLVYGYRTWTRDKTVQPDLGSVVLWDKGEPDLVSIELKTDKKISKLERRGQGGDVYWWGLETTIEKKPKPPEAKPPGSPKPGEGSGSAAGSAADGAAPGSAAPPAAAGSGAGSGSSAGSGSGAGSGSSAGSGSAAAPTPVAEEEVRKTREFPVGEAADTLVKGYAQARALRDLGVPTDDQKKDYKLNDAKTTLTVTFKNGARTFLVGGSVYGGSDRYVVDQDSKRAFVLSKDLISTLEIGESSLHLLDPRGFDAGKEESVTIEANGKSKTVGRVQTGGAEGQQVKTWGDPETKKPDQTIANFIDNTNNLRPAEYESGTKVADLTQVLKLTYKDARGNQLGTLVLYKREKPGELPLGAELDPANPPKSETEYLILTEKTRVPATVRRDSAQRTEQDIDTVFSDHPTSIEPKGNPFGNTPLPPRNPHDKAPPPADGKPAGAPAGSPPGMPPAKGDAPKAPGAAPEKADAPKAPGAAPAKADAPKAPGSPPAKADPPKAPAAPPH